MMMKNFSHDYDTVSKKLDTVSDYKPPRPAQSATRLNSSKLKSTSPININDSFHIIKRPEEQSKPNLRKKALSSRSNQDKLQSITPRPVSWHVVDSCDLRLFIIRHGERVDRYFGPNWYMFAFDHNGQYRPYHANLPVQLPNRANKLFWAVDTPLTNDGLNAALNVGRVLGLNRFHPNYAYSSPATRCVMTTYQILKGLGLDKDISIRIEPGLLEFGAARFGMDVFITPQEWKTYGINVDTSYQSVMSLIPPVEREAAYYLRSKQVIREIEKRHDSPISQENLLLVGHATSPETLTWDLVGRQPNVNDLYALSLNIGYLQMVISERNRHNRGWAMKQIPLQSTTLKWV